VKGRVTLVSPALDPGSTTIEVWVEASKPDPALRPGITVTLSITAKTVKDAIVVPASAVFKNPEGADIVLLAGSDGHAHVKTVQIGVRAADRTQIVSGIKVGDAVISSGGYALPDNTAIKIEAPPPGEKDAADKGDKAVKAGDSAKPAEKDNSSMEWLKKAVIIVDNVETPYAEFKLDPDRIESVSILKDKSAIAIYGEKGKNGVIIVKTKKPGSKVQATLMIDSGGGDKITMKADSINFKPIVGEHFNKL